MNASYQLPITPNKFGVKKIAEAPSNLVPSWSCCERGALRRDMRHVLSVRARD